MDVLEMLSNSSRRSKRLKTRLSRPLVNKMFGNEYHQMKLKVHWVKNLRAPEVERYLQETKRKCPKCQKELEWNPQSHSISCSSCNFVRSVDSLPLINRCLICKAELDDEYQLCSTACRAKFDEMKGRQMNI